MVRYRPPNAAPFFVVRQDEALRADSREDKCLVAQFFSQLSQSRGHRMLQPLCFVVNLKPSHPEDFGQHALNEVMPKNGLLGYLPTLGRKLDMPR